MAQKLSKSQWAAFNRLQISLEYWLRVKAKIYWVTLTSAPDSPNPAYSFRKLLVYIEREYGERPEYMRVLTNEGFGVLHCFLVFTGRGMPRAYKWLSETWDKLHGAWNVSIRTIGGRGNDAARVARYAVTQYATSGQGTSFIKCTWSPSKIIPFKVQEFLKSCSRFLRQECFTFCPWHVTYRMAKECALSLIRKGWFDTKNGYRLGLDFMTYGLLKLSTPFC